MGIKAGNILIDSDGSVKLADFGVSNSIYEQSSPSTTSAPAIVDGTSYWLAPEVIRSHTRYSFKADIWSFGITALELAHGRPPLSHFPPSKSFVRNTTNRFRLSSFEKIGQSSSSCSSKEFSPCFKDLVGLCLDQNPVRRPPAEELLEHSFFKNCNGANFLVENLLQGLPSVEQRFKELKIHGIESMKITEEEEEDETEEAAQKQMRISGWNFKGEAFLLDPVFAIGNAETERVIRVRFGGETIIPHRGERTETSKSGSPENTQDACGNESEVVVGGGGEVNSGDGSDIREAILSRLKLLKQSLDEQMCLTMNLFELMSGSEEMPEVGTEVLLMRVREKLTIELEHEKKRSSDLEMEVKLLESQLQPTNPSD